MAPYDGLTRNTWTGTWSPTGAHPIALSNEIRGGLHAISGDNGDTLEDISGQRLQEGMLVYVKNAYDTRTANTFYQYKLLAGQTRNTSTGYVPNTSGNWTEVSFGGNITNISDIGDVSTSNPSVGQVLKWDGSAWAPASDSSSSSGSGITLTDLSITTNPAGNAQLTYDNTTGTFEYTPPDLSGYSTFSGSYNDLTDKPTIPVVLTDLGITDGTSDQVLTTDGNGNFSFTTVSSSSGINLTDISVNTSSPGSSSLTYDDSTGIFTFTPPDLSGYLTSVDFSDISNTPTTLSGYGITDAFDGDFTSLTNKPTIPTLLTDLSITDGTNGQVLTTDGSGNFSFTTVSGGGSSNVGNINDLSDVDTATNVPTDGQALVWDSVNGEWIPGSVTLNSISSFNLSDLADVDNTTIPSSGQVLKWNGTSWAPASDSVSSTSGGITLSDISVTVATNFGQGNLTYNDSTGVLLFTPPDLSGYSTFSGNYSDLQGIPTLFSGDYNDLTNTPATSDNLELSLTGTTTLNLVNGDDNSIIDSVDLSTITSGLSYNDLDDLPSLFSGNYNDLTNTPNIPSLSGYATQSYVQTYVAGLSSDNITEGGTNLYYADERVDDRVSNLIQAGVGLTATYDDNGNMLTLDAVGNTDGLTEGTNNLWFTDERVDDRVAGLLIPGTGIAMTYDDVANTLTVDLDNTTVTPGTYGTTTNIPVLDIDAQGRITGASTTTISTDLPVAADTGTDTISLLTDTLTISGGTGVSTQVNNGIVEIGIGQPVGTTDDVTFNDVTVDGDLTVNGTLTSISTNNTQISDNVLVLNEGETGAGVTLGTSGIEVDRGTESNVRFVYDEADDQWSLSDVPLKLGNLYATEQITQSITTSTSIQVNNKQLVYACRTTDATETEAFLNDGVSKYDLPENTTSKFRATFVASNGSDQAAFIISGLIVNNSNNTQLIGTNNIETLAEDSNGLWTGSISANDIDDYLKVTVTGEAANTIDWTIFLEVSEVIR